MTRWLALAALLLVPGCLSGQPPTYGLSFGSDTASPVVVTALAVNGQPSGVAPQLIDARSDDVMPRANAGMYSMAYPRGNGQTMRLDVEWVELLTRRAYAASADVPLAELQTNELGGVYVAPVFGAGGLMRVTSDPAPGPDGAQRIRDLVELCGTRNPAADRDYAADPDSLPGLDIVLAHPRPAPSLSVCAASEG